MERVLLYYPTIEFINESWLRHALLYSDKVSSIIPYDSESKIPETFKDLRDKGEYIPTFIGKLIKDNKKEYDLFADRFLHDIDNTVNDILKASSMAIRPNMVDSLSISKFSPEIINKLDDKGYVKERKDEKIRITENIAIYYMSVLAKFASSVEDDQLVTPSTDYERFSHLSFDLSSNTEKTIQALNLIYRKCLPIPDDSVELSDIINFKSKYKQDLLEFRKFESRMKNSLKNCNDKLELKECLLSLNEEITIELKKLENLYSKNKINVIFSSLNSLFGIEKPKLFDSLLGAGVITTAIDLKVGLVTGAVLLGGKLINHIVTRPRAENEFNYLFHAKRGGIIK